METEDLRPDGYIPRLCDDTLSRALETFGAVEVAGPMWCGKTWTSLSFGKSVSRIGRATVRRIAEADPAAVLLGEKPHVIDEWQDVPPIWDAVRDAVDESGGERGLYILTGSSSLKKDAVSHSGAGRIAKMRMRTMSLVETGDSTGEVSLAGLFRGRFNATLVQQRLAPLAEIVCRGGWPELQRSDADDPWRYLDSYLDAVFDVSVPRRGLNGGECKRVAHSLARNVGSAVKLETLAVDAFPDGASSETAKRKASECVGVLESLYLLDPVAGWDAPIRSKSRLRIKPKFYFADVSLAASLLQVTPERVLQDGQLFGLLFETLCMHDLAVYASVLPHAQAQPLLYYRDSDGLEVDAIIELRDGRWAGFEIKLGEDKVPAAAKALNRLRKKVAANPAARNPAPEFMAVLVGAGESARYDPANDVYVIPITSLGA